MAFANKAWDERGGFDLVKLVLDYPVGGFEISLASMGSWWDAIIHHPFFSELTVWVKMEGCLADQAPMNSEPFFVWKWEFVNRAPHFFRWLIIISAKRIACVKVHSVA